MIEDIYFLRGFIKTVSVIPDKNLVQEVYFRKKHTSISGPSRRRGSVKEIVSVEWEVLGILSVKAEMTKIVP